MKRCSLLVVLVHLLGVPMPALALYTVMLRWDAPTPCPGGTPFPPDEIAGYHLRYGTVPGQYTQVRDVGLTTQAALTDLADGTAYYVVVSAYDRQQRESPTSAPELRIAPPTGPVPAPDTTPPMVRVTTPPEGTTVPRRTTIGLQAVATDNIGVISVVFTVNGSVVCTATTAPWSCPWTVPAANQRTYQIQAKAFDGQGNVGVSTLVTVTGD